MYSYLQPTLAFILWSTISSLLLVRLGRERWCHRCVLFFEPIAASSCWGPWHMISIYCTDPFPTWTETVRPSETDKAESHIQWLSCSIYQACNTWGSHLHSNLQTSTKCSFQNLSGLFWKLLPLSSLTNGWYLSMSKRLVRHHSSSLNFAPEICPCSTFAEKRNWKPEIFGRLPLP